MYAVGMLLGAFFLPYLIYAWWYLDEDEPFKWYHLVWPVVWIWRDIHFHSKASYRRVKQNLKIMALLVTTGAYMGWGIVDGLARFFR